MLSLFAGLFLKVVPGLGILPSWVWRAAATVVIVLGLVGFGWVYGRNGVLDDWTEERGQRAIAEIKLRAARVEIVTKIETKYRERDRIILQKGEIIIREVPNYVTKSDNAACELRTGFLREYDASLRNESAGPAVDSDREPAGIALSDATEVIAANNVNFTRTREKLAACVDFYRQQQLVNSRRK